jgi:hypothetical protein
MSFAQTSKGGSSPAASSASTLDDFGAEFENMCAPPARASCPPAVIAAAADFVQQQTLTILSRRASAKLEFLRLKKAQDLQRAAEAKAKQDEADHRAALVSVFAGVKAMNEIIDKACDDSWSYRQVKNFIDICFMLRNVADSAKATGKLMGNSEAVAALSVCGRLLAATVSDIKAWERQGPRRRLMMSPTPPFHPLSLSLSLPLPLPTLTPARLSWHNARSNGIVLCFYSHIQVLQPRTLQTFSIVDLASA